MVCVYLPPLAFTKWTDRSKAEQWLANNLIEDGYAEGYAKQNNKTSYTIELIYAIAPLHNIEAAQRNCVLRNMYTLKLFEFLFLRNTEQFTRNNNLMNLLNESNRQMTVKSAFTNWVSSEYIIFPWTLIKQSLNILVTF